MERTTRKELDSLVRQLAAACGKKWGATYQLNADGTIKHDPKGHVMPIVGCWYLDSMNPGDGRTFAVEEMLAGGGASRPLGHRRMTQGELCRSIRVALEAVRIVLGEEEYNNRIRPVWRKEGAH